MKMIGYARVSTKDQNLDGQIEKIKKFCDYKGWEVTILKEKVSSVAEREQFEVAMNELEKPEYGGLIVTDIDRLGRSVYQLSSVFKRLTSMKKELIIIDKNIDTSTKEGRLQFNILSSFAEWEREQIRDRLKAGQERTQRYGGRPRKDYPKEPIINMYKNGAGIAYITKTWGISKGTLYKRLREWGILTAYTK